MIKKILGYLNFPKKIGKYLTPDKGAFKDVDDKDSSKKFGTIKSWQIGTVLAVLLYLAVLSTPVIFPGEQVPDSTFNNALIVILVFFGNAGFNSVGSFVEKLRKK